MATASQQAMNSLHASMDAVARGGTAKNSCRPQKAVYCCHVGSSSSPAGGVSKAVTFSALNVPLGFTPDRSDSGRAFARKTWMRPHSTGCAAGLRRDSSEFEKRSRASFPRLFALLCSKTAVCVRADRRTSTTFHSNAHCAAGEQYSASSNTSNGSSTGNCPTPGAWMEECRAMSTRLATLLHCSLPDFASAAVAA